MKQGHMKGLLIGTLGVVMGGCATQYSSRDIESRLAQATSGSDGDCVVAIHLAAEGILAARAKVDKANNGKLPYSDYKDGMAAANSAVEARKVVAETCTQRYQALRATTEGLEASTEILAEAVAITYAKTESLLGVTFQTGSDELQPEAKTILTAVASRLVKEGRPVEIAGHTSSTGAPEFNLELSQKRAEAVVAFLVSQGVNPANLVAKGYGMSQPVTTNETAEGREANQRVELRYIRM